MQAIPSTTPLSRTAPWTSSVMSVTVRPPAVRSRVSCWKTFIAVAILRQSLPATVPEPAHPQRILHLDRRELREYGPRAVGKGASRPIVVVTALAAYLLAAGAGTGAAADGHLHWRDDGRGPWITDVCSLPIPHVGRCSAAVVTNSAGRPQASSAPAPGSLGPGQFHSAYSLPTTAPNTETIGIVDAYDDPSIANDLARYDS